MLQKQFLEYKMTRSLGDKLLEDKTQETDLYTNEYKCRSIFRYVRALSKSQKADILDVLEVSL